MFLWNFQKNGGCAFEEVSLRRRLSGTPARRRPPPPAPKFQLKETKELEDLLPFWDLGGPCHKARLGSIDWSLNPPNFSLYTVSDLRSDLAIETFHSQSVRQRSSNRASSNLKPWSRIESFKKTRKKAPKRGSWLIPRASCSLWVSLIQTMRVTPWLTCGRLSIPNSSNVGKQGSAEGNPPPRS